MCISQYVPDEDSGQYSESLQLLAIGAESVFRISSERGNGVNKESGSASRSVGWSRIVVAIGIIAVATGGVAMSQGVDRTELSGQTAGGAYYRITAPAGWLPADGLVIWNHGYDALPISPNVDLGPLAELQLAEGYAVAASGYRDSHWALFDTVDDLRELVDVFESQLGEPGEIFLAGLSMGGLVTAQAIEKGRLGNVVGAFPVCGIMSPGVRWWDQLLDHRLIYDFVCGDVPGGAIEGGGGGLPFPPQPGFDPTPQNPTLVLLAIDACLGIFQPAARSAEQQTRMDRMMELTGGSEFFAWTNLFFATFGISDLVNEKLDGANPLENSQVVYDDPELDAAIERIEADRPARRKLIRNFTPRGGHRLGDVKIVSLHTDKDGLVPVEAEGEYDEIVRRRNLSIGVVVEEVPSHCGFTLGELVGGWEALRAWVAGGHRPSAADLQQSCEAVVDGGLGDGPCRIDPNFVIGDLDDRVPPRGAPCG